MAEIFDQEKDEGIVSDAVDTAPDNPTVAIGEDIPPARERRTRRQRDKNTKDEDSYTPPPMTIPQVRVKLKQLLNTTGGIVMLKNPYDGQVILANADAAAEAYTELAKRHKSIRRAIEALEAGGAYGTAISVTLAMALPILANHGKLPPAMVPVASMFGYSAPGADGNADAEA